MSGFPSDLDIHLALQPQDLRNGLLLLIGNLYRIEDRLREAKAGPALREAVRAAESAMIYKRIGKIMNVMHWLFFGSKDAGHAAASIYTLVENCRRFGVPGEAYLKQLLETLPGLSDEAAIAELTPARIAEARRRNRRVA